MNITLRPLSSIHPYEQNPRVNDHAVDAVARSISQYGFRQPVVVDGEGVIIVGHTRYKAALKLGLAEVPVHVAHGLSPAQARAYRLADNATNSLSEWDTELLPIELTELKGLGVELTDLGFTQEQLDELLAPAGTPDLEGADEVPPVPAVAVTRPGDLWTLGEHRLLCGDSIKLADVQRVLNGRRAALCATDPPYLVDYTGERPNDSGKDWSGTYREIDILDADSFFRSVFTNVISVLGEHAAIYCWHAHKRQGLISKVWSDLGILDHQQIVWVKPTPVFGRVFWHFRHEPAMMGWKQGSMPEHDSDHSFNSVWEIDWEGKSRIVGNEHPTQKPVEIFARPIRKHTRPGDTVLEPFSGSGSQLIAAEMLGRRCCAIELEPVFVDVGLKRWMGKTQGMPVLEATGQSWDEVVAERAAGGEAEAVAAGVADAPSTENAPASRPGRKGKGAGR